MRTDPGTHRPGEEWLLYLKRSIRKFEVIITNGEIEFRGLGTRESLFNVDLSFGLTGFSKSIKLSLTSDKTAPRRRRFFGTAPLIGTLLLDDQPSGSCIVQNSYDEDVPVIRLETKALTLDAYRVFPNDVCCPMIVHGMPKHELRLGVYQLLSPQARSKLPKWPAKRHFAGSCTATAPYTQPVDEFMEILGTLVTISQLLVMERYMNMD